MLIRYTSNVDDDDDYYYSLYIITYYYYLSLFSIIEDYFYYENHLHYDTNENKINNENFTKIIEIKN